MPSGSDQGPLGTSVESSEITDLTVDTADIKAKAVTQAKMADGTANKILGFDGSGVVAEKTQAEELISDYIAVGAEANKTITPSTALDFTTYKKIIVRYTILESGASSGILQAVISAQASAYYTRGARLDGTAITHIAQNNTAQTQLASASLFISNSIVTGEIEIEYGGTGTYAGLYGKHHSGNGTSREYYAWENLNAVSTVSSIKLQMSAGQWAAGTIISIYGVRRT